MVTVTISAKVPVDMMNRISKTGYSVSDLIQVSLDLFLDIKKDEQDSYMLQFLQEKKLNRALARYSIHKELKAY